MINLKIGSLVLCKLLTPNYDDIVEAYGTVQGIGRLTLAVKFDNNWKTVYVDRKHCFLIKKRGQHGAK
jgi:hypothetical protein